MEIKYEITEGDYINFNLYHIENSPSQRKLFNLIRFTVPTIFAITVYYMGSGLFN